MNRMYRWINLIGLAGVLIVNALAQWLPLGGKTTGEISAQYPVLVMPAGYAFSIWSVIYALLIGFVIYPFTKRGRDSRIVSEIGIFFLYSCIFNCLWLFAWHYEKLTSSVLAMVALLLTLIVIYVRIHALRAEWLSRAERWFVRLPFSLYLGWICVATIVNIATVMYAYGWDGLGLSDVTWAIIMLTVALLLAMTIGWRYVDPAFVLVFVWAFIAIAIEQRETPPVAATSAVYAGLLFVYAIVLLFRARIALGR